MTAQRPTLPCTLTSENARPQQIKVNSVLDTGADITIVSLHSWPPQWPMQTSDTGVFGLGGTTAGGISLNNIWITNPEGQTATVKPYITSAPLNLWGRDCLSQWGVKMTTDF